MKLLPYNQPDFSITSDLLQGFIQVFTLPEISLIQKVQRLFFIVLVPCVFAYELLANAFDLSLGNLILLARNRSPMLGSDDATKMVEMVALKTTSIQEEDDLRNKAANASLRQIADGLKPEPPTQEELIIFRGWVEELSQLPNCREAFQKLKL